MKLWIAGLGVAMVLSGCGVDGEPTPPPPKPETQPQTGTGVRLSGDARVGISVSRDAPPLWSAGLE
jgi:hypothetical protein